MWTGGTAATGRRYDKRTKREIPYIASSALIVRGWLYTAGEDAVETRERAKEVSREIVDLLYDDSPAPARELAVAAKCAANAKVVESRLSEFKGDGLILKVNAVTAPPGVEPGDYALDDTRVMCGKMSETLAKWTSSPVDLVQRNLKRCPFCNGEARLEDADDYYGVECKRVETCGARVFFEDVRHSREGTYRAWQRRRSVEDIREEKNLKGEFHDVNPHARSKKLKSLRPCPFCGGLETAFCEAGAARGDGYGVIVCLGCGANVSYASASDKESENDMADRWSRWSGKGE
ncbi:MAG: Lar family restriction alleviation protein [Bacteroidales bacterium]|nr:Lar family restriction alleviation protein [Bacteroidales bacterium]